MTRRVALYVRSPKLLRDLRDDVERRGDVIVGVHLDDGRLVGRGKYTGWRAVVSGLAQLDRIAVGCAGDLPGRNVNDLLGILSRLQDDHVSLRLYREGIDTEDGPAAILDLIAAYRRAKLSQAIRHGISKARIKGKVIGRPAVPDHVRQRVMADLANGNGIRSVARRFGVSPATVINIRDSIIRVGPAKMAA